MCDQANESAHSDIMLSINEAAAMLECTRETLVDHLKQGSLPGLKIGRSWVLPRAAFVDAINALAVHQALERRSEAAPKRNHVASPQPGRPRLR
jgi:excisionase family DNA binding protein